MSGQQRSQLHMEDDSVTVFECVTKYIGNEKEIELRRCSTGMFDIVVSNQQLSHLYSGSYGEGFRLKTSDMDIMLWYSDIKAVCDVNQINTQNDTNVLLVDTRHCRPGFSRLKVVRVIDTYLQQCVTFVTNGAFLNASQYKETFLSSDGNYHIHGPCCTSTILGTDFDNAFCIKCDYWPTPAAEFITRSTRHQWPSALLLDGIVKNGCHLVPICAKFSENEDIEWRISFSMSEKSLIFAFNHTQFLCYGLLKLVLSQVINKESHVSDLLCSYFLKTAVFWEIQESNPTLWRPGNILTCFWNCFDRLISWVNSDFCPNFFIPENNMFFGKFTVTQQRNLVKYLQTLRNVGTGLFYRIPDLMCEQTIDVITPVNPMNTRCIEFYRINANIRAPVDTCTSDKLRSLFVKCLLYKQHNTALAPAVVLDITLNYIVKTLLFRELNDVLNSTELQNKDKYKIYRSRMYPYMRYLNSSSPSFRLYLATVLYTLGQYNTVIDIVTAVQSNVHPVYDDYQMLLNDPNIRKQLCLLMLFDEEDQVNELIIELVSTTEQGGPLIIPPLLYIKWLMFMCFYHTKNRYNCNKALEDLHMLLFDDGINIPAEFRDLTYNMVGMCYELYGDHRNALLMYKESKNIDGFYCTAGTRRLEQLENKLK